MEILVDSRILNCVECQKAPPTSKPFDEEKIKPFSFNNFDDDNNFYDRFLEEP